MFSAQFGVKGKGSRTEKGALRRDEIAATEEMCIKACQEELKNDKSYQDLANKLKLLEDRGGVLKYRRKLENSDLDMESQQPIILAKDHRPTKVLIEECHRKVHYGGVRATLGELRSRFWVPKGQQVVKKVFRDCVTYKKEQCKPIGAPPTASLLEFRVREAPPFSKVGIYFAGPLFVKTKPGEMVKAYVALFTCCVTRDVHLDLVTDLTATTLVRCLRKCAAGRGTPSSSVIISDKAKTIKASAKLV